MKAANKYYLDVPEVVEEAGRAIEEILLASFSCRSDAHQDLQVCCRFL